MQNTFQLQFTDSIFSSSITIQQNGGKQQCSVSYYELGRYLGRSSMGYCYEARKYRGASERHLGVSLVLKIMEETKDLALIEQIYQNEIRSLELLNSSNCNMFVKCLGHWRKQNKFYIIYEKSSQGNLKQFIEYLNQQKQTLSQLEIIYLLRQIGKAVFTIHQKQILHRNLNLSNIQFAYDMNIKIADFSLALAKDEQIIKNMMKCGTPTFMAPQILCSQRAAWTRKSDIWSIGVILYFIIHLKMPFEAENKEQLRLKLSQNHLQINKHSQLKHLLLRMLQKDPKKRISVQQLLGDTIFEKITNQNDIKNQMKERFDNYFNKRKSSQFSWKRKIDNKRIEFIGFNPKDNEKNCVKRLVHLKKYGYFMLLSNFDMISYFNNGKVLKYSKYLEQLATQNEEKIICWVYKQYFSQIVQNRAEEYNQIDLDELTCTVRKIVLINQNVFIRLTNNVFQMFIPETSKIKSETIFLKSIDMNYHKDNHCLIRIRKMDKQCIQFQSFEKGLATQYNKQLKYIQNAFQIILENSMMPMDES